MSIPPKAPPVYKPTPQRLAAPQVYSPNQANAPGAQVKAASNFKLETRPMPLVYRPQQAQPGMQAKTVNNFGLEKRPAPLVYRPNQVNAPSAQLKAVNNSGLETRPVPPVYRPNQVNAPSAQLKAANNSGLDTRPEPLVYRPQEARASILPSIAPASRMPVSLVVQASKRKAEHRGEEEDDDEAGDGGGGVAVAEEPRARRKTTENASQESKARAVGGRRPSERSRRLGVGGYSNVEAYEALEEKGQNLTLDAAIKGKKIFSGDRRQVPWSPGFSTEFWETRKTDSGWVCAKRGAGCTQRGYSKDHGGLEIGHKKGFYGVVEDEVEQLLVCDGVKHWWVLRLGDVIRANEDKDNLEPQCEACNRAANQQKKDRRGKGDYGPEEIGPCPGPKKCGEDKISEL